MPDTSTAPIPPKYRAAAAAGARVIRPVEEQFHGDLMATLEDPFGYSWFFATRVEDLSQGELERRSAEYEPER